MEAGPGQWVQRGKAGGPTVLAGHFPPPGRLGPQHRLSQAGEFGGGEAGATTTRGRLWGRLEGVQGRQAKLGQVWSLAVLLPFESSGLEEANRRGAVGGV